LSRTGSIAGSLGRSRERGSTYEEGGKQIRVIHPRQPGPIERIREFWQYRQLTIYFGRRLLEKLYRRTWLGWWWIPLRPVISIGSRVFVFGGLLGVPSEGVPYLLFFVVGLTGWQLFSYTLFWATRSVEQGQGVLRRVYVPRLTCLLGSLVPSGVNFLLYVLIAIIIVIFYLIADGVLYVQFGLGSLLVIAGLFLCMMIALSIGLWTSIYGAQARDVRFGVNYGLSFWFFLTPVIYPLSEVPAGLSTAANLNPVTAPLEMIRLGLFGAGEVTTVGVVSSLVTIAVIGGTGLWFFNRSEAAALDSV
jgi:lipopolysaccharide transport system permease protein